MGLTWTGSAVECQAADPGHATFLQEGATDEREELEFPNDAAGGLEKLGPVLGPSHALAADSSKVPKTEDPKQDVLLAWHLKGMCREKNARAGNPQVHLQGLGSGDPRLTSMLLLETLELGLTSTSSAPPPGPHVPSSQLA